MGEKTQDKWMVIVVQATGPGSVVTCACPACAVIGGIRARYVADKATRIGYLTVWCDRCLNGFRLSRCAVPEGKPFSDLDGGRDPFIPEGIRFA